MTHRIIAFILPVLAAASAAPGALIARTGFEEPVAVGGSYIDTGDPLTDHALETHADEPVVNSPALDPELGFTSRYLNTRDSVGLTDGDEVGVTSSGPGGGFAEGDQGFVISDTDGTMEVTLDPVDFSGFVTGGVTCRFYAASTGYESDDRLRIDLTDGTASLVLVDWGEAELEARGDAWQTATTGLSAVRDAGLDDSAVSLRFAFDSNAGSELAYFDDIRFTGAVPEPASAGLCLTAATALLALRRCRQRR
ncbi:hypothetical protein [Kiritimatiella glycovorans]|uniref:PEP-CTERM protein-sorting domain-containing protein n=1 Tax=Kiritimatiella glycovorans TaxID=1307763 RepID=A0A0G3EF73_9BACT|nr:hypothetical protein [Kiritimatiella glycovorans]AKJ64077.1 hypothetical protein L21SP4_00814 [Kiritimatiella glycovorans]